MNLKSKILIILSAIGLLIASELLFVSGLRESTVNLNLFLELSLFFSSFSLLVYVIVKNGYSESAKKSIFR